MKNVLRFAAVLLITASAQAGTLSIRVERPDFFKLVSNDNSWNIILEGEIDPGAPARVAAALKQIGRDGADVYLRSPGGSLLAGIEIGRLIRREGANTYLGGLVTQPSAEFGGRPVSKPMPGGCYSACALAFLGGVYRYSNSGSEYGVHRFSSTAAPTSTDMDKAQIISAAVNAYIREMDVDPELFDLMVQAGKDKIRVLNSGELTRLQVVNNGRKRPEWTIEATDGGQYLRGVQDSVHGQGKAVLYCQKGQMYYLSYYQGSAERAQQVASGSWYHSVMLPNQVMPLPRPTELKANGNEIYAMWPLPAEYARAIATSASIGHAMQLSREAPTFVGYSIDIPPGPASQRVGAFIRNCLKSASS